LPRGAVVGSAKVVDDGHVIKSVPVVLLRTLPAVSGLTLAARAVTQPLPLALIVVALVLGAVALGAVVVRRRRGSGPGSSGRTRDSELEVA
jgi:hypothetical protein